MNNPTPYSHLYRLALLIVVVGSSLFWAKGLLMPDDWNYDSWYRGNSLEELQQLPLVHGGNDSCQACHQEIYEIQMEYEHKSLNCESCHGPLAEHVLGENKIADAVQMIDSDWQCMVCHRALISRPNDFPVFTLDEKKHKNIEPGKLCINCHNAHVP